MHSDLLVFLKREANFFIEAEAKFESMKKFIEKYNLTHRRITLDSEGIIILQDDANKWGLELRLYVESCPPEKIKSLGFKRTSTYRNDYSYRLNNNEIVWFILNSGYSIGVNRNE